MGLFDRSADHQWTQRHLSHYVEGDLAARARRRLDRHAADCPDCGRGILAMRALVRLIRGIEGQDAIRAPAGIFHRVRLSGAGDDRGDGAASPQRDS